VEAIEAWFLPADQPDGPLRLRRQQHDRLRDPALDGPQALGSPSTNQRKRDLDPPRRCSPGRPDPPLYYNVVPKW
jgi:hypothetical protein